MANRSVHQSKRFKMGAVLVVSLALAGSVGAWSWSKLSEMFKPGGGSVTENAPACAHAGQPIVILLDLAVWGAGGDVGPRFDLVAFEYRLLTELAYRNAAATLHRQDTQHKILKLTIPPYPAQTVGTLEYRFKVKLDGDVRTVVGKSRVDIGEFGPDACTPVAE